MQQKTKPRQVRCMLRARSRPDLGFFSLATSCAAPEVCGAVLGLVPAIQQDAERPLLPALPLRACIFRFENAFLQADAVRPLEIFARKRNTCGCLPKRTSLDASCIIPVALSMRTPFHILGTAHKIYTKSDSIVLVSSSARSTSSRNGAMNRAQSRMFGGAIHRHFVL